MSMDSKTLKEENVLARNRVIFTFIISRFFFFFFFFVKLYNSKNT